MNSLLREDTSLQVPATVNLRICIAKLCIEYLHNLYIPTQHSLPTFITIDASYEFPIPIDIHIQHSLSHHLNRFTVCFVVLVVWCSRLPQWGWALHLEFDVRVLKKNGGTQRTHS